MDKNQEFLLQKTAFGLSQFSHVLHICDLPDLYERLVAVRDALLEILDREEAGQCQPPL